MSHVCQIIVRPCRDLNGYFAVCYGTIQDGQFVVGEVSAAEMLLTGACKLVLMPSAGLGLFESSSFDSVARRLCELGTLEMYGPMMVCTLKSANYVSPKEER